MKEELEPIIRLYDELEVITKIDILTIYPFGEEAGMPLKEWVSDNPKRAMGYFKNHNDLLAKSLEFYYNSLFRW